MGGELRLGSVFFSMFLLFATFKMDLFRLLLSVVTFFLAVGRLQRCRIAVFLRNCSCGAACSKLVSSLQRRL